MARLGPQAFETISGEVVNVALLTLGCGTPAAKAAIHGIDASNARGVPAKAKMLRTASVVRIGQLRQLQNPDARVTMEDSSGPLLDRHAAAYQGIATGDYACFGRYFWEFPHLDPDWRFQQSTVQQTKHYGGREHVLRWGEEGEVYAQRREGVRIQGQGIWNRRGIVASQMGNLPVTLYGGDLFDNNSSAVGPLAGDELAAVWCFCSSPGYSTAVRRIDQKMNVTNATLVKIRFDSDHWKQLATERYPNGLPQAYSDDPTQWIYHGHPCGSVVWDEAAKRTVEGPLRTDAGVLQVAAARLVGYRWPAELDPDMELADGQREWAVRCATLHGHEDEDGIVCLPSLRGERPGAERLLDLIRDSYADGWADDVPARLLDGRGTSLDDWLRNRFFDEHCKLFHHRPFIWHVWDGRKRDGFHALVNYHRLADGGGAGRQLLESLAYSYLGDWIARQRDGVARGEAGSDGRLAAALELQNRLTAIIEGEPPFDLFVRWKALSEQALGWNPDLNDGVRLNIRPFLADDIPGGKKGAGILRSKPNVHWRKDRGREPLRDEIDFPWFWADGRFTGERVNDRHFSIAEKRTARDEAHR